MTALSNEIRSGVGFRHVQLFALAADGYPNATDTSEYAGLRISGARALTINDPEPQQISHLGDDRVFALDVLPPTEALSGELVVGKVNDVVAQVIGDDLAVSVGEAQILGIGTDNRGDENQVALLAYRQTLDTDPDSTTFGSRRWEFRLFPKTFVIERESGFQSAPEEKMYTIRPQFVTKHLWGTAFAVGTEGFEQAQGFRGISEYKPRLASFLGDSAETDFAFDTDFPAQSTDKIAVWVSGVLTTASITKATTGVQWTTAPITDAEIVIFYEHT